MVYLDTNILIYAGVEQDIRKKEQSLDILEDLIDNNELVLSTLVLQEFVFTMAKLKIDSRIIRRDSNFYFHFVRVEHDYTDMQEAVDICCQSDNCKNINDILHLILAEKSKCRNLITFDSDFKKIADYRKTDIQILTKE